MTSEQIIKDIKLWKKLHQNAQLAINARNGYFEKIKGFYGCTNEFGNQDAFGSIMNEKLGETIIQETENQPLQKD